MFIVYNMQQRQYEALDKLQNSQLPEGVEAYIDNLCRDAFQGFRRETVARELHELEKQDATSTYVMCEYQVKDDEDAPWLFYDYILIKIEY